MGRLTIFTFIVYFLNINCVLCLNPVVTENLSSKNGANVLTEFLLYLGKSKPGCSLFIAHDVESDMKVPVDRLVTLGDNWSSVYIVRGGNKNVSVVPPYWFSWLEPPRPKGEYNPTMCATLVLLCNQPYRCTNLLHDTVWSVPPFDTRKHRVIIVGENADATLMESDMGLLLFKLAAIPLNEHPDELIMKTLCFFCNGGKPELRTLGKFQLQKGYKPEDSLETNLFPDFTLNLNKTFMQGSFIYAYNRDTVRFYQKNFLPVFPPMTVMADVADSWNIEWDFRLVNMSAGAIETQLEDGRWVGMIGEVLEGGLDFAGPTIMAPRSYEIVEFPTCFMQGPVPFISRRPQPLYPWNSIFKPFTLDMWIGIIAASSISIFVFRTLLYQIKKFLNPFSPKNFPRFPTLYSLQYMFLPLIEENPALVPTSHAARMFVALWWMFSTVITCGYDTKLISFLVSPDMEIIPKDFGELIVRKDWIWGMGTEHLVFFKMLVEDTVLDSHRVLYNGMLEVENLDYCVNKAARENFGCVALDMYLMVSALMNEVTTDGHNPLILAKDNSLIIFITFILPKYSILRPTLDRKLYSMMYSGLVSKYTKDFYYNAFLLGLKKARLQKKVREETSMALNFEQMKGPLLVLGIPCIAALIVFIWEILHVRNLKKKAEKQRTRY